MWIPARNGAYVVASLLAAGLAGFGCSSDSEAAGDADELDTSTVQLPLGVGGLCGGERCDSVARGLVTFFDRKLHGLGANGRACADCHMATDSFQLSPANAEARWQRLQRARQHNPKADDPLFRAIDADDFRTNGADASDFSNVRENGLVRVSFPLPANIKLIDPATGLPSSETTADVWRSVPSVLNVKLSGPDGQLPAWFRDPNKSGGYQLDGRFGTLQEQALGAFRAHAEVDTDPSQRQLDDLSSFQRVLFSSPRLAAHSRALDEGASPPDADGPLNALEQQGKAVFVRSCGQCHGGVAGSTPIVQNFNGISIFRYTDIQANCPRQVDTATPPRFTFAQCPSRLQRNVRTWEVTLANGTKIRKVTNDPGRALLTGFVVSAAPSPVDDWGKFDPSPMRGISKTAPYFHNNSANTLDEVLDHYDAFFKRVAVTNPAGAVLTTDGIHQDRPFTAAERPALLAYLHKL